MGEIRFVGTGETRGYHYPVCKKIVSLTDDPHWKGWQTNLAEMLHLHVYLFTLRSLCISKRAIVGQSAHVGAPLPQWVKCWPR